MLDYNCQAQAQVQELTNYCQAQLQVQVQVLVQIVKLRPTKYYFTKLIKKVRQNGILYHA